MDNYDDEREQYPLPIELYVKTRAPSKWRMVDLETGDVWKWVALPEGITDERHFEPDYDLSISSEVMNERTRRRLELRASGSAGPHDDAIPRERAKREAIDDQVEDPEAAEEILTARDADRGIGPAVRADLSDPEWKRRHWDTHYAQDSE